jgi:hypothetical protein
MCLAAYIQNQIEEERPTLRMPTLVIYRSGHCWLPLFATLRAASGFARIRDQKLQTGPHSEFMLPLAFPQQQGLRKAEFLPE